MQGYQLTFFTQQSREHGETSLADWLLGEARRLGIRGATQLMACQGFGHDGRYHSGSFFDLDDQPVQVVMVVAPEESERLFARIEAEGVRVFYTKAPVEFAVTGAG